MVFEAPLQCIVHRLKRCSDPTVDTFKFCPLRPGSSRLRKLRFFSSLARPLAAGRAPVHTPHPEHSLASASFHHQHLSRLRVRYLGEGSVAAHCLLKYRVTCCRQIEICQKQGSSTLFYIVLLKKQFYLDKFICIVAFVLKLSAQRVGDKR